MIRYYVPTRGRLHMRPTTLEHLQLAGLLTYTSVVCPAEEAPIWAERFPGIVVVPEPESVKNIGDCRAFMFDHCPTRYFFMIDDDVSFSFRNRDGSTAKVATDPQRFRDELHDRVMMLFLTYPVVGIGSRLFSQDRPYEVENKQTGWAWGYDRDVVANDLRQCFGRLILHEDADWCITLLEHGHRNVIASYLLASGRRVSADPSEGGCGSYRNAEMVKEQTEKFIALHPGIVTPRVPRAGLPDYTQYVHKVSWKKAFRYKVAK